MKIFKISKLTKFSELGGEWWIIDGEPIFADGDIGDMNHEAYVVQSIQSKYAYDEFNRGEWIDWDGFKLKLAREKYEEENGKIDDDFWSRLIDNFPKIIKKSYLEGLKELGMTDEEYQIAEGQGDARDYGMKHLGWKRVHGNSIQTYELTGSDLKEITNGLYDINGDDIDPTEEFEIEVMSTVTMFENVPWSILSEDSLSLLMPYRMQY